MYVHVIIPSTNIKLYKASHIEWETKSFKIMCNLNSTKLKLHKVKVKNRLLSIHIEPLYGKPLEIIFDKRNHVTHGQFIKK
jgi:hypothetical protein